ncbi:MAG: DUF4406 domain-containing protein [Prevotella sp.]|nr:DUF4406 domain-containing protein [Prevotella sp.]
MKRERNHKVYISGPMTDKETGRVTNENIMAFVRANSLLKKEGYTKTVSPTRVWVCRWPWMYRLLERMVGRETAYRIVLLYDVLLLLRCDRIYKIPGWRDSRGANIESCVAYWFNLWVLPNNKRERVDRRLAKSMEKWRTLNNEDYVSKD